MNRRWLSRELKPLKTQHLLKNFSVFDIETNRWQDDTFGMNDVDINEWMGKPIEPFLLTFYDGTIPIPFDGKDCIEKFLKFFLKHRHRSPHICFSHNGGKFDMLGVFHCLLDNPKNFEIKPPMLQKSRIMALKIADKNNDIWTFRDSFSLLPKSLDALCEGFKTHHRKTPMPICEYKDNKSLWQRYNANDCIALYEVLQTYSDMVREIGGTIGYTQASTSLKSYRLKYQPYAFKTYHIFNNIFRNAYYGGRCEIYSQLMMRKNAPFYYYDINSMYPYVMRNNRFPTSFPIPMHYDNANECIGKLGIMECKVYTPDMDIPLLPLHTQVHGVPKLIFPVGEWTAFYDFSLIEKALELGYMIDPLRVWEFNGDYIFKEYMDMMYKIKQENKNAKGEVAKLNMNSLYGKYGEREEIEELVTSGDFLGLCPNDEYYGFATKHECQPKSYHLPAISIHVTALAQVHLYNLFEKIMSRDKKIYYCDTDSVITDARLPVSSELGDIKMEFDFEYGVALCPKFYYFQLYDMPRPDTDNDKIRKTYKNVACKGFSYPFKKRLTYDMLEDALLNNRELSEKVIAPSTFKESVVRKTYDWTTIVETKSVRSSYDKRRVRHDYTTEPLRFPEDFVIKELVKIP